MERLRSERGGAALVGRGRLGVNKKDPPVADSEGISEAEVKDSPHQEVLGREGIGHDREHRLSQKQLIPNEGGLKPENTTGASTTA